ncbi:MAG: hypothetical protein Q3986_08110 [Akkermansia sp.]|nr:hypothetical protein [Akkermansia sp.]
MSTTLTKPKPASLTKAERETIQEAISNVLSSIAWKEAILQKTIAEFTSVAIYAHKTRRECKKSSLVALEAAKDAEEMARVLKHWSQMLLEIIGEKGEPLK